jgi:hypothetical protein
MSSPSFPPQPQQSNPSSNTLASPLGLFLFGCFALGFALGLTACIAPPPKCAESGAESGSGSSSTGATKGSVEDQVSALGLVPVVPTQAVVWDGENESRGGNNIALINIDPAGSWFTFNDGSPDGTMTPPSTGDFVTAVNDGYLHTKGSGFKEWGGGVGMNFVGAPMLTPVDVSKYKGISFKASGKGWVHVGLATVITLPEFEICKGQSCYDHYAVDIQLTDKPKKCEFTWKELRQVGFGAPRAKLDPKTVVGLNFTSKGPTAWDFTLDDVGFIE